MYYSVSHHIHIMRCTCTGTCTSVYLCRTVKDVHMLHTQGSGPQRYLHVEYNNMTLLTRGKNDAWRHNFRWCRNFSVFHAMLYFVTIHVHCSKPVCVCTCIHVHVHDASFMLSDVPYVHVGVYIPVFYIHCTCIYACTHASSRPMFRISCRTGSSYPGRLHPLQDCQIWVPEILQDRSGVNDYCT